MTGITAFQVTIAISYPDYNLGDLVDTLKQIFLIFPHFALSNGLSNLDRINTANLVCQRICEKVSSPCDRKTMCAFLVDTYGWQEPGIGRNLAYMGVIGVGPFILLLIIEYRIFASLIYYVCEDSKQEPPQIRASREIDSDVKAEKKRINSMSSKELQTNNLVVKNLTKYYGKFLAVNQISFGVKRYCYYCTERI